MAVISASEIGVDEDLALRVLATAHTIAPRLDALAAGPSRDAAVAILRGIARDGAKASRAIKGQRAGSASVEYTLVSWFSDDDRLALRALCGDTGSGSTAPVGRFPEPGLTSRLWPERYPDTLN